ncbi:MAG: thermonuclease family protein [Lachnospiraceae bacterium]|nr:thermonuclease family protein [Lachnospiraceae bacterium]
MNKIFRSCLCLLLVLLLAACEKTPQVQTTDGSAAESQTETAQPAPTEAASTAAPAVHEDFAAKVTLDMASETLKQEVTVKTFVDGDTVHFHVPESVMPDGVLKARFLGLNTPESTGKVEEYGKAASKFTREKLENAVSIVIESDSGTWNPDSGGERYLVWVWYCPKGESKYRNLNIELLQNGLAKAYNSGQNRYGETCLAALAQAMNEKCAIYSGEKDPEFFYGDALELTLREIRLHAKDYEGSKVAFEAVVTRNSDGTVYVEEYDPELDLYFGMTVYLGYGLSGEGLNIMNVGNRVRIVGTLQYYEAGGTWQVSGLSYKVMRPDDPGNIQKISEGNPPANVLTTADRYVNGKVDIPGEDEAWDYAALVLDSTLFMKDLYVKSVKMTDNKSSSSYGALTLYCESDGVKVTLRTGVFHQEDGSLVPGKTYLHKTIDVTGVAGIYDGAYQIRLLTQDDIQVHP